MEPRRSQRSARNIVADPRESPEACHWIWYVYCSLQSCTTNRSRRGAWFLHDLIGDAPQLFRPCMIRLDCRHDVFHAPGDARDRRDGGRVSFFTNSPHIARRVERIQTWRDSGLRDLRGSSTTSSRRGPHIHRDALAQWSTGQPRRLDPPPNIEEVESAE